jgi:aryl-alcohol dehydrogenase-like predicted oxidoreductase
MLTLPFRYKVHPISAVRIEYSPFTLDIEDPKIALLQTCRGLGVAVVVYSPLGRGFLTGKYRSPKDFSAGDMRTFLPRFNAENFPKNLELLKELESVANDLGEPVGTVTLAWLLAQGDDIIPIPGTTKKDNFDENIRALNIQLPKEVIERIREAVDRAQVSGDRYDPR